MPSTDQAKTSTASRAGRLTTGLFSLAILFVLTTASAAMVRPATIGGAWQDALVFKVQQSASERAENIRLIQRQLQTLGFYDGAIDGVWGRGSTSALRDFYRSAGFSGDFDQRKASRLEWAARIKEARKVSVGEAVEGARRAVSASDEFSEAYEAREAGRYEEAERLYRRALEGLERVLGKEHPTALRTVNNLAGVYQSQGRYEEAERLYRRALEGNERVLGKEHPTTLDSVNNLANVYWNQGRYEEAGRLHRRALEGRERVLGKEHPATLDTVDNLAVVYKDQGRYEKAARLHRRALEGRERVLGKGHPSTLGTVDNLAIVHQYQGRYEEAEGLFRRAFEGRERVLGQEHPTTLGTVNNLAVVYRTQGRYEEAERLLRRALVGSERVLGKEHPRTLATVDNLAIVHQYQGRYEEAERLLQRALVGRERVLGKEHPRTLGTVNNLALVYRDQGRYEEAETLYRRALERKERVLGQDHPTTLLAANNLAAVYESQGRYEEAERLYQRSLEGRERVLGKEHPRTLGTVNNLALVYRDQGHYEEAERLYRRALEGSERVLGKEHHQTLNTVHNLAGVYQSQGRYDEAERLYRRAFEGRERVLGKAHPRTLATVNGLANVNWVQGRYEEAEGLYRRALEGSERVLGESHPETLSIIKNLANLYRTQNHRSKAFELVLRAYSALPDFLASGSATRDAQGNVDIPIDFGAHLASVSASDLPPYDQARMSFEAQGWWTFGRLDVALNDLGARLATEDEELASGVRDFQETREKLSGLRDAYARSFEDWERGEAVRESLSERIETAEKEFDALKGRIERDFPELAELTLPRSLKVEEAQELLGPGEGLVAYAATDDKLYAWLVTQDRVAWKPVSVTKARLEDLVGGLGASVDLTRTASDTQLRERCAVTSTVTGMEARVFDACKAKELHDLVLGTFDLSGIDHMIVVPDGPLEKMPFSMLVTGLNDQGKPEWLIEDHAISMLPTTSSLRALRQAGARMKNDGQKPYFGIAPVAFGERGSSSPLRGELADLPGTENEVRFLSGLLGSGRDGYVTGSKATETYVKNAPLDDFRVLSFATHGLVSRQTRNLTEDRISEPALVLASSEDEDGLLTASEAATLRLDADWVLLSGCNTASGEAADAEGLSGLARAFFFAGARSLLVSHWSIDDNAAMDVMVETMKRSTGDTRVGKAQALRQAVLTVMNKPGYEHPFFWAPFSLVGVGR